MKEKVFLYELFIVFAKIGVMTFGGGTAMLPMLIREVDEARNWASEEELADYFAIGQCTPGIIAVNTATFVGQKKRGIVGGIAATFGIVFPSLVIITALAGVISLFMDNEILLKAFAGIRVGVCVLVINTVIKLAKSALKGYAAVITFVICVILAAFLSVSPVIAVILALIAGIIGFFVKKPKEVYNG